jgi:hypothetical protein
MAPGSWNFVIFGASGTYGNNINAPILTCTQP